MLIGLSRLVQPPPHEVTLQIRREFCHGDSHALRLVQTGG
jgi:hypothetical protein